MWESDKKKKKKKKKEDYFRPWSSDDRYRPIVRCRGHQSRPWPCLQTNLDFLPLRLPPASSDSPSTVWSSRSLQTGNVSVFLPFFLREALIRHANACNTRSRSAGLAPLLVPGPLNGKASIRVTVWGRGLGGAKSQRVGRLRCWTQQGLSPAPERTGELAPLTPFYSIIVPVVQFFGRSSFLLWQSWLVRLRLT